MSKTSLLYLCLALLVSNFQVTIACGPVFNARNVGNNELEQVFYKFRVSYVLYHYDFDIKIIFTLEE